MTGGLMKQECSLCKGSGIKYAVKDFFPCPECGGAGWVATCATCGGSGQIRARVDVTVPIELAFNLLNCPECAPNYLGRRVDVEGIGVGEVIGQSGSNVTIAIEGEGCKVVVVAKSALEPS